jgi:hypothetical protein
VNHQCTELLLRFRDKIKPQKRKRAAQILDGSSENVGDRRGSGGFGHLLPQNESDRAGQETINRANAQSSTGPSSVEGKAVSSPNSLKWDSPPKPPLSPAKIPPRSNPPALKYHEAFESVGVVELNLVETMIRAIWMQAALRSRASRHRAWPH